VGIVVEARAPLVTEYEVGIGRHSFWELPAAIQNSSVVSPSLTLQHAGSLK
jgi:hypothetical protein